MKYSRVDMSHAVEIKDTHHSTNFGNRRFDFKASIEAERDFFRRARKSKAPQHYHAYIKSPAWAQRRQQYFSKFGRACAKCGTTRRTQLHHIVYSARGREKDKHLSPLCRSHHDEFHSLYGSKGNMTREWNEYLKQ